MGTLNFACLEGEGFELGPLKGTQKPYAGRSVGAPAGICCGEMGNIIPESFVLSSATGAVRGRTDSQRRSL